MSIDQNSNAALEVSDQAEYNQMLLAAPIAELAEYLGVDIDEAVNMRVMAMVESTPPKLEITARPVEPKGNLMGFASVKIGSVTVDDFKIAANKDGQLFVGMPSKPDSKSRTGYRNTVRIDKEYRDDFNAAVLSAHYDAVARQAERAEKMQSATDKPRMAEQMDKAEKQAAEHNAAMPPKDRGGKAIESEL